MRLLDVNVLIALAWPTHVHHAPATEWFLAHQLEGWATCRVTESRFVRVSSNHRAMSDARTPGSAAHLLALANRIVSQAQLVESSVPTVEPPD
jgi:predicted nucleic acid-binding protein